MLKLTQNLLISPVAGGNMMRLTSAASFSTSSSLSAAGDFIDRMIYDYMPSRFLREKWSKIICIEGNIGVGKKEFAKALSERFDLKNFGNADPMYEHRRRHEILKHTSKEQWEWENNPNSLVQRTLNCSIDYFLENPGDWEHTCHLRYHMMDQRSFQYNDALAHLLHVGQGAALIHSFYSDKVFAEAQQAMGWFVDKPEMRDQSGRAFHYYLKKEFWNNQYFFPPHIVLYLNMPADQAYERVQENGSDSAKCLPLEYYQKIEESYLNNLNEWQKNGVKVIELKIGQLPVEDLLQDLYDNDDFDIKFSRWEPHFKLDRNLRRLKTFCMDPDKRHDLHATFYCPVECTWKSRMMADQYDDEYKFNNLTAAGFDPKKNPLYWLS